MAELLHRNDNRPRIAVAGATGRVGSALIAGLMNDPVDIVALSRKPDTASMPEGVVVKGFDFEVPATMAASLEGEDRLFIAHGTSPTQVADEIALIDAAVSAGVGYIVKLSVMGPPLQLHPFDWHREIEAYLATCDVGYALLRPTTFVDVLSRAGRGGGNGRWGGAAGSGRVNLIDPRDVADCARAALLDAKAVSFQRAYHLTGPRGWSMAEIADELSRLLGRTFVYENHSPPDQRALLIASGLSELVADLLLGLDRAFRESSLSEVTSTVLDLTGHAPRTVPDWLAENIALFGGTAA